MSPSRLVAHAALAASVVSEAAVTGKGFFLLVHDDDRHVLLETEIIGVGEPHGKRAAHEGVSAETEPKGLAPAVIRATDGEASEGQTLVNVASRRVCASIPGKRARVSLSRRG